MSSLAAVCALLFVSLVHGVPCPYEPTCSCTEEKIDCTNRGLTSLPALNPGNFTQLELDISGNQITTIGDGQLPANLQDFYSKGNPIVSISDHAFLGSARTLTNLILDNGKFTDLPKALEDLDALAFLEIAKSELKNIVASKEILPNLYYLNLYANKISNISGIEIFKHSLLSRVDLHNNQITSMAPLAGLDTLRTINLMYNQICDHNHIAGAIAPHAEELNILNLKNNCLKKIPDLSAVGSITNLLLGHNEIDDCNSGKLPKIINFRLNLSHNKLTCIPSCVADAQNISTLMLDHNMITGAAVNGFTFPDNVGNLGLDHNNIDSITKLNFANGQPAVGSVNLNTNPLTTIADDAFSQLSSLTKLNLDNAKLSGVPVAIKDLPNLESLNLNTNPLTCDCSLASLSQWYQAVAAGLTVTGQCGADSVSAYLADLANRCPNVVG